MQIDDKLIIKYFDILINDIDDNDLFSVNNTLIDNNRINTNTESEKAYFFKLVDKLKKFGERYEYLETLNTETNSFFKLTNKGIQLKEFKKGHIKFDKSLKKQKLTLFEKLSVCFIIISAGFALWQQCSKDELKNDYKSLKNQYDSLKAVSDSYKSGLDSFLFLQAKKNLKKDKQ
jgi:hypothetical protein